MDPNSVTSGKNIEELRAEIDRIDAQIIKLMAERLAVAEQIGVIKKELKLPITDRTRELELAELHQKECQKYSLKYEEIEALFHLIIALAKKVQK